MFLLFKIALLISLVRLSIQYDPLSDRPLFLATFYTLGAWFFNLVGAITYPYWPFWMIGGFLLSWLYFWLLSKLEDAGIFWVLALIAGLPIVLI